MQKRSPFKMDVLFIDRRGIRTTVSAAPRVGRASRWPRLMTRTEKSTAAVKLHSLHLTYQEWLKMTWYRYRACPVPNQRSSPHVFRSDCCYGLMSGCHNQHRTQVCNCGSTECLRSSLEGLMSILGSPKYLILIHIEIEIKIDRR